MKLNCDPDIVWKEVSKRAVEERERRQFIETNKGELAGKKSNATNDACAGLTYDEFLKAWNAVINLELPTEKFEDDPICKMLHEDDLPRIIDATNHLWTELGYLLIVSLHEPTRKLLHPLFRRIETIFITLLGSHHDALREGSVRLLNVLYDGHNWQSSKAFPCKMACVGDDFDVKCSIKDYHPENEYYLYIATTPYNFKVIEDCNTPVADYVEGFAPIITTHTLNVVKEDDGKFSLIPTHKLMAFPKSGYFDYKIVEIEKSSNEIICNIIKNGRYVVYRQGLLNERWHEVVIDLEGIQWDETQGNNGIITKRGTFADVTDALSEYKEEDNITSLYLMGVLDRDNGGESINDKLVYKRPDASPIALIDRTQICKMVGGDQQLRTLMDTADELDINVSIQYEGNISASRYHRKYRDLLCYTLDLDGQIINHKGTDGKENQWEDQLLLNYRKIETWDIFIDDLLYLIRRYGINGCHIREAQSYPIILYPELKELTRKDSDNQDHYNLLEIIQGSIVESNIENGYWKTQAATSFGYPNPFFIRLNKRIAIENDSFLFTGDSHWDRDPSLVISGILPYSNKLASSMALLCDRQIMKSGTVLYHPHEHDINPLYSWLKNELSTSSLIPEDSFKYCIRYSCNETLPYPALLYGRGAWTAVDLLFTLPGIPMTFIGEERGKVYRVDLTNVYSTNNNFIEEERKRKELIKKESEAEQHFLDDDELCDVTICYNEKNNLENEITDSILSVAVAGSFNGWSIESHQMKKGKDGNWKINFKLAPERYLYKLVINGNKFINDPENEELALDGFGGNNSVLKVTSKNDPRPRTESIGHVLTATEKADAWWGNVEIPKMKFLKNAPNSDLKDDNNIQRVQSWSSLQSARLNDTPRIRSFATMDSIKGLSALESKTRAELGPEYGFDLFKIKLHYNHREHIRDTYPVFKVGKTVLLEPQYDKYDIFTFARCVDTQMAVIITNTSDQYRCPAIDFRPLEQYVVKMQGWSSPTEFIVNCSENDLLNMNVLLTRRNIFSDDPSEVITPREFILGQSPAGLKPHSSVCHLYEKLEINSQPEGKITEEERNLYYSSIHRLEQTLKGTSTIAYVRSWALDDNGRMLPLEPEVVQQIRYNHIFELLHMALRVTWAKEDKNHLKISLNPTFDSKTFGRDISSIERVFDLLLHKLWLWDDANKEEETLKENIKKSAFTLRQSLFLAAHDNNIPSNEIYQWIIQLYANPKVNKYIKILCNELLENNKLGPILFVTPELGRWSTVGGLGVMVDELSKGLAQLGCDVTVISPYYNWNRKGETGYLERDGIKFDSTIEASVSHGAKIPLGIHKGTVDGVKLIFMHNFEAFPRPYPGGDPAYQIHCLAVMAKGALEYCCQYQYFPSVVITNDWFTGLTAGYARGGYFGDPSPFRDTSFLHIAHNLDPSYEGRIYPSPAQGTLEFIHEMPWNILKDPYWSGNVLNPSRAAILMSDNWCTVSRSYREDLKRSSPLANLLNRHPKPFGYPNGVIIAERQARLMKLEQTTHEGAKALLQQRYFGFKEGDNSIPLYAFVGRITEQKGVHLIANAAEQLIGENGGRILFLVGGMATETDPYAHDVANSLRYLHNKYPNNFWADPGMFFTDGPLVNLGADFGLMPSLFEPGGIVQHEFFVAGTPVIAFKTGGLKDTVHEYVKETGTGNGFTFESHTHSDYVNAVHRSLGIFYEKEHYNNLRMLAAAACIDLSDVSWAWYTEFNRIRRCILGMTPVILRYNYSGKEDPKCVEITGSFSDWKESFKMEKSKIPGNFELQVYLKPGVYQYKYKVDNEWKISRGYPVGKDPKTGQLNNVVTVEDY